MGRGEEGDEGGRAEEEMRGRGEGGGGEERGRGEQEKKGGEEREEEDKTMKYVSQRPQLHPMCDAAVEPSNTDTLSHLKCVLTGEVSSFEGQMIHSWNMV